MQPQPVRMLNPFRRGGLTLKVVIAAVLLALASVVTLVACVQTAGQGNGQGGAGQGGSGQGTKGISLKLSPSSRNVDQGQSTTYTVDASSTDGFAGPVSFAVTGLPAGASAAMSPSSANLTSGSTMQLTLTVSTSPTTPAGKVDFTVTGTGGSVKSNAAKAQLQVKEVKRTFGISGALPGSLAPGVSLPVDLQISNPEKKNITITNLSLSVGEIVRTPAAVAAGLPCTAEDYSITQFTGTYPLTVQPGSSGLSGLGIPEQSWPRVTMLDTLQLQDGCKGATLQLTYSGTGQGN